MKAAGADLFALSRDRDPDKAERYWSIFPPVLGENVSPYGAAGCQKVHNEPLHTVKQLRDRPGNITTGLL